MSQFEWLFIEKNVEEALKLIDGKLNAGESALAIHDELYPYVQSVINPPFINPHLPKMHRICRDFYEYLTPEEGKSLLKLETSEYVRREKFTPPGLYRGLPSHSKEDLIKGIEDKDRDRVTNVISAMGFLEGKTEVANTVMSLCSGYLNSTLGHSISCTALILQEYLYGNHMPNWPTYTVLADYLCKGNFSAIPEFLNMNEPSTAIQNNILRAVSGTGIDSLHDTITIFAVQSTQPFVSEALYNHLVASWIIYLDNKDEDPISIEDEKTANVSHYQSTIDFCHFFQAFQKKDAMQLTSDLSTLIPSKEGRRALIRFIIKSLCDDYNGNYNPHFFTGLGSLSWVLDSFYQSPAVCKTALHQYLDFVFNN